MTPNEKAEELVRKYTMHAYRGSIPLHIHVQSIKKYILIAVDEILDVLGGVGVYGYADSGVEHYWEEVKEEIKKL